MCASLEEGYHVLKLGVGKTIFECGMVKTFVFGKCLFCCCPTVFETAKYIFGSSTNSIWQFDCKINSRRYNVGQ